MSIMTAMPQGAAVEGINPNLLRNWYFVGGGTGRGVFPVNQRGATSGTFNTGYFIDGWKSNYNVNAPSYSLTASGMVVTTPADGQARIAQTLNNPEWLGGKNLTASVLSGDGTLYFGTITRENGVLQNITTNLRFLSNGIFEILGSLSATFVAVKLELGTEQTLAHQENGVWVLNEIPDYEEELIRCMTSTADPTDTYANKTLATGQELAYVENGTTASRVYAIGEYFCWHGLLYRVKAVIGNGDPFTVNTNCEQVTDGGLNELQSGLKTRVSFTKYQSTTASSFQQIVSNRWAIGADDVQTKIASASRGMTMLEVSTSPTVGGAMVYKYNDSYWTAFLFTYALPGEYAIVTRENTGRTIVAYAI